MSKVLISKDVLDAVLETLSFYWHQHSVESHEALRAEMEADPWLPISEFMKDPVEGLCHITINGHSEDACYSDGNFSDPLEGSEGYWNRRVITHVMPIHKPEPPKGDSDADS